MHIVQYLFIIVLYSPYLGSNGMDVEMTLSRSAVYAEVRDTLHPQREMDSVLLFIPEEAEYRVTVLTEGM